MPVDLPCHLSIGRLATAGLDPPVGWLRLVIDPQDWPATTAQLASIGAGWRPKLATAGVSTGGAAGDWPRN